MNNRNFFGRAAPTPTSSTALSTPAAAPAAPPVQHDLPTQNNAANKIAKIMRLLAARRVARARAWDLVMTSPSTSISADSRTSPQRRGVHMWAVLHYTMFRCALLTSPSWQPSRFQPSSPSNTTTTTPPAKTCLSPFAQVAFCSLLLENKGELLKALLHDGGSIASINPQSTPLSSHSQGGGDGMLMKSVYYYAVNICLVLLRVNLLDEPLLQQQKSMITPESSAILQVHISLRTRAFGGKCLLDALSIMMSATTPASCSSVARCSRSEGVRMSLLRTDLFIASPLPEGGEGGGGGLDDVLGQVLASHNSSSSKHFDAVSQKRLATHFTTISEALISSRFSPIGAIGGFLRAKSAPFTTQQLSRPGAPVVSDLSSECYLTIACRLAVMALSSTSTSSTGVNCLVHRLLIQAIFAKQLLTIPYLPTPRALDTNTTLSLPPAATATTSSSSPTPSSFAVRTYPPGAVDHITTLVQELLLPAWSVLFGVQTQSTSLFGACSMTVNNSSSSAAVATTFLRVFIADVAKCVRNPTNTSTPSFPLPSIPLCSGSALVSKAMSLSVDAGRPAPMPPTWHLLMNLHSSSSPRSSSSSSDLFEQSVASANASLAAPVMANVPPTNTEKYVVTNILFWLSTLSRRANGVLLSNISPTPITTTTTTPASLSCPTSSTYGWCEREAGSCGTVMECCLGVLWAVLEGGLLVSSLSSSSIALELKFRGLVTGMIGLPSSSVETTSSSPSHTIRALAASAQLLAKIEVASFALLEFLSKDSILFNSMMAPLWSVPPLPTVKQQTAATSAHPSGTDHTNVFVPLLAMMLPPDGRFGGFKTTPSLSSSARWFGSALSLLPATSSMAAATSSSPHDEVILHVSSSFRSMSAVEEYRRRYCMYKQLTRSVGGSVGSAQMARAEHLQGVTAEHVYRHLVSPPTQPSHTRAQPPPSTSTTQAHPHHKTFLSHFSQQGDFLISAVSNTSTQKSSTSSASPMTLIDTDKAHIAPLYLLHILSNISGGGNWQILSSLLSAQVNTIVRVPTSSITTTRTLFGSGVPSSSPLSVGIKRVSLLHPLWSRLCIPLLPLANGYIAAVTGEERCGKMDRAVLHEAKSGSHTTNHKAASTSSSWWWDAASSGTMGALSMVLPSSSSSSSQSYRDSANSPTLHAALNVVDYAPLTSDPITSSTRFGSSVFSQFSAITPSATSTNAPTAARSNNSDLSAVAGSSPALLRLLSISFGFWTSLMNLHITTIDDEDFCKSQVGGVVTTKIFVPYLSQDQQGSSSSSMLPTLELRFIVTLLNRLLYASIYHGYRPLYTGMRSALQTQYPPTEKDAIDTLSKIVEDAENAHIRTSDRYLLRSSIRLFMKAVIMRASRQQVFVPPAFRPVPEGVPRIFAHDDEEEDSSSSSSQGFFSELLTSKSKKAERDMMMVAGSRFWYVDHVVKNAASLDALTDASKKLLTTRGDKNSKDAPAVYALPTPVLQVLHEQPYSVPFSYRVSYLRQTIFVDRRAFHLESKKLGLRIRRSAAYNDGFTQLIRLVLHSAASTASSSSGGGSGTIAQDSILRCRWHITFLDSATGEEEAGIDAGGVFKEFLELLVKQAFDPAYGLFTAVGGGNEEDGGGSSSTTATGGATAELYPNPQAASLFSHEEGGHEELSLHYRFLGLLIGKAMYEGIVLSVNFAPFFLNSILGKGTSFDDLATVDPQQHRSLKMLLSLSASELDDMCVYMCVEESGIGGGTVTHDLIPGGRDIQVSALNVVRYVHLAARHRLSTGIQKATEAFTRGLSDIMNVSQWLKIFSAIELQQLIRGLATKLDIADLREHTKLVGGFDANCRTMKLLWEVLEELSVDDQSRFLQFCTGSSRPPLLGFAAMSPPFSVRRADAPPGSSDGGSLFNVLVDIDRLPSAATCFNLLKLPPYMNKANLKEKLLTSIRSGATFDLS